MPTKTRSTPGPSLHGTHTQYVASTGKPGTVTQHTNTAPLGSFEECISRNTPGFPRAKRSNPFRSEKKMYDYQITQIPQWSPGQGRLVSTEITQILPANEFLPTPPMDLEALGATGFKRFKPKIKMVDTSLFLLELRELPGMIRDIPHLLRARILKFAELPAWFISYAFGWAPLFNDIKAMYEATHNIDKIIKQALRDNNQNIRRGGTLLSVSDSVTIPPNAAYYKAYSGFTHITGSLRSVATSITSQRAWFAGKFRYSIPHDMELKWSKDIRDMMLGNKLHFSLSTLYNALPWSWLFDWFTNLGDVVENFDPGHLDNLVAEYATCQGSYSETLAYSTFFDYRGVKQVQNGFGHFVPGPDPASRISTSVHAFRRRTVKRRVIAHPYGFGFASSMLSDYQSAILVSLGMMRQYNWKYVV